MVKRLSELEIGSSAIVLDTIGNKDFIARLCALGLCAQDKLTIEAKSYKGKTIKVAVVSPISKTMIAIRDTEASLIMVQEDNELFVMSMKHIRVAVAGQPNTGKSSLINRLTGAHLTVGNFPGVTVESREITCMHNGTLWTFIDLPGTYALNTFSEDERVATEFILQKQKDYDIVITMCDACQLEKNLQLSVEIITQINKPVAVVVSMVDEATADDININTEPLTKAFGVPFLLHDVRVESSKHALLSSIQKIYAASLEGKTDKQPKISLLASAEPLERSRFIHNSVNKAVKRQKSSTKINWTDIIDRILLHPILGAPSLLAIMFGMFFTTFSVSEYPSNLVENLGTTLSRLVANNLPNSFLIMAISDGIIPGVFVMLSFLPKIVMMCMGIFLLERSGYMARIVFITDGLLRKLGIESKAMVPLITGMSCSVPAYMATRILPDKKSRIVAMFAIGMIPCSAKTILFILLTSAFFSPTVAPWVMTGIYLLGIVMGLASAAIVSYLTKGMQGTSGFFAFEMPKYRWPELRVLCSYLYIQIKSYIKSAALLISLFSFLLWTLSHIPAKITTYKQYSNAIKMTKSSDIEPAIRKERQEYVLANSIIGYVGKTMVPIFKPLGFDWKMNISLLTAIAAKEVAISTLGILYQADVGDDEQSLREKIREVIPFPAGIAYIMFTLIYLPCISATIVFAKEIKERKYVLYLIAFTTILAWLASFFAYRICLLFS